MKKGYIKSVRSVVEFQEIVTEMNEVGVNSDQITINKSFEDFADTTHAGDLVVVYSLDCFNTISELKAATVNLADRGVDFESICDPWYRVSVELISMLDGVTEFGARIRTTRTRAGLLKAKAQGKKLGRPAGSKKLAGKVAEVEKLRKESKISIAQACAKAECNPRSYYRYVEKTRSSSKTRANHVAAHVKSLKS